ncbi:hypothetical protein K2173_006897 [Erythroxylum novogranatense]|uniref:NAB domain-containing protein n=1 Tax=Erythroxylum novogranatense TaxID=1862640 RepID=A0AAV8SY87_9ROSI|nr:hypothetical protein K2173_006897 [Erythroxylum novogranatense]
MDEERDDNSTGFSWWSDSHKRHHQSQWLRASLSDLEKKTSMMVNIIQNNGDTFAERSETFYKRRHELVEIVKHLHESYQALAEKYNQLRSEWLGVARLSLSSPSLDSSKQLQFLLDFFKENKTTTMLEASTFYPEFVTKKHSGTETQDISLEHGVLSQMEAEIVGDKSLRKIINGNDEGDVRLEGEELWNELRLKIWKLMEENMRQQAELAKRNDEKREIIKHLQSVVNELMEENRALKSCLPGIQSSASKRKGINCIGKFNN